MQRTLSEHIRYLEERIKALNKELEEPDKLPSAQSEIRVDIGIATRSLEHFRKAFELEQKLSRTVESFKNSN
jgi:hypothetical protein